MNLKNKVIDKVSDLMSYPARRKAQKAMIRSDSIISDMKIVRESKGKMPYDDNDFTHPLIRARSNVISYKSQQEQALKKIQRKSQ